jgi:cystathionine gamma-synthase
MPDTPHTAALHADGPLAELPDVAPPLRPATTFDRVGGGDTYRRAGHETVRRLEAVLGSLEGGHAVVYPSGMGAVDSLLRHVHPRRVALPEERYHGVYDLVHHEAERGRWSVVAPEVLEEGDIWWLETPSNPTCRITDIAAVAAEARERGVIVAVDATFATPVLQATLALGAHYAMHSTTKFIGGHSDAMGGVIVTADESTAADLREARTRHGLVPGAMETWLTLRGVRTLPLRVARQSASALAVAEHLVGRVAAVHYPGLRSDPGHAVASRQMSAFGGVLAFDVETAEAAAAIVRSFAVFRRATSLGGVESLAEHRLDSDPDAGPGIIRLSIGLEEPEVLTADLDRALAASS